MRIIMLPIVACATLGCVEPPPASQRLDAGATDTGVSDATSDPDAPGNRDASSAADLVVDDMPGPIPDMRSRDDAVVDLSPGCDMLARPVAYWRMESISATSEVANEVGEVPIEARDGSTVAGIDGNALGLDGASLATVEHHSALELESGTISFWVRLDDAARSQMLVGKDANGGSDGHLEIFSSGGIVEAKQEVGGGADVAVQTSNGLVSGVWYHVGYVWGSVGARIYVDGERVGTTTDAAPGLALNTEVLSVGFDNGNSTPGSFDAPGDRMEGAIDELAFFARPFSPQEMRLLYNCPALSVR